MSQPALLWLAPVPLLLASGSVTRARMLDAAGVPVEAVKPLVDEREVERPLREQGASAMEIAAALACAKALAVSVRYPGRVVLGADQTLICGDHNFHKPADAEAARRQIALLAGREHELHSAFVLARDGELIAEGGATAHLLMREMSPGFIAGYVAAAGDAALTSVGAYQIESVGAQLFERIDGDHFTILGLPLLSVLAALRDHGLLRR